MGHSGFMNVRARATEMFRAGNENGLVFPDQVKKKEPTTPIIEFKNELKKKVTIFFIRTN